MALSWFDMFAAEARGADRWPDPLSLGQQLDPPRTGRTGKRIGTWRSAPLDIVCRELVDLSHGSSDRLQIYFPPQEGKSTTVAQWFPLWLLANDPSLRIAVMSYGARLARKRGKWVRDQIIRHPNLGVSLKRGAGAADNWETTAGGGMISVGLEGGITGEPVDVLIIDDPVKGRAQAESSFSRDHAWDWWENNGATRLSARGFAVLMMTRWHTDDLAGRLLREEPSEWRVVSIPAIAEPGGDDPLGREAGGEFPSVQDRPDGWFSRLQKLRSPYVWQSIYQQRPTAAEGNLFKRDAWRYWVKARNPDQGESLNLAGRIFPLSGCDRFITADLAVSTKTRADFTVFSAWAMPPNGDLVLLDRWRGRVSEADHFEKARPLVERWRIPVVHVEASQHSTTLAYEAGKAGIPVAKLDADSDKMTRAIPAANRQRQGRVWLPEHGGEIAPDVMLDEWIDEHADFDSGAHDDQVDTTAYAARVAGAHYVPPGMPAEMERAIERAQTADGPNLMAIPM